MSLKSVSVVILITVVLHKTIFDAQQKNARLNYYLLILYYVMLQNYISKMDTLLDRGRNKNLICSGLTFVQRKQLSFTKIIPRTNHP